MKRFLLYLLLPVLCFNLAGGYSIAAGLTSEQAALHAPFRQAPPLDNTTVSKKETSVLAQIAQVLKEVEEEAAVEFTATLSPILFRLPEVPLVSSDTGFAIQHYLSLYDRAVKVRQPQVYLLDCVFIL